MEHLFPVLIAEDDLVTQKLIMMTLEKAGHTVQAVTNGIKALNAFKKQFYPILITDWEMPGMTGVELCKLIRDEFSNNYVFIILLTARDKLNDVCIGLDAGADDYITKPFNPAELLARINGGHRILQLEKSLKEANKEIMILSITDPLTKSYNRGFINERLPKEIKRAKRYHHLLSLIMIDIDYFKKLNDTFGHLFGDKVLKGFVDCIYASIRFDIDWIGRFGGEEFLVILPETDFQGGMALAYRLRDNISKMSFEADSNKSTRITASLGVTTFDPAIHNNTTAEMMIAQADRDLYKAKEAGRNKVMGNILGTSSS